MAVPVLGELLNLFSGSTNSTTGIVGGITNALGITGSKPGILGIKKKKHRRHKSIPAKTIENMFMMKAMGLNPTKNPMVAYKLTKYL